MIKFKEFCSSICGPKSQFERGVGTQYFAKHKKHLFPLSGLPEGHVCTTFNKIKFRM